ncbi:hypothetical protein [uncultured Draconibacterium sp.]|uniref:HYC_CC_PP family protein n=1 Tax=uncultured Draconibacterium sp. TaxID=1573823 RepID=UPI0032173C33
MLKKFSQIFLAILFMVTTMGMTVSKHYCGSSLQSVSVFSEIDPCCDMDTGCCHDEQVNIDIEDDYSVTSNNFDFSIFALELPALLELFQIDVPEQISEYHIHSFLPERKMQTVLSRLQSYLL